MNQFVGVSKVVGIKQTLKAVKNGKAIKVVLADNTDETIRENIILCCEKHQVALERVTTKAGLGKAAGIDCAAAVIAIIE